MGGGCSKDSSQSQARHYAETDPRPLKSLEDLGTSSQSHAHSGFFEQFSIQHNMNNRSND